MAITPILLGLRTAMLSSLQYNGALALAAATKRLSHSSRPVSSVLWAQGTSELPETVYIVDPRTVLSAEQGPRLSSVQLELPQALLRQAPHFELGEADDPMSTWVFGKRAEIFEYRFIGSVATQSGWVSLLSQEAFRQLQSADKAGQAPLWDAVRQAAEANDGLLTSTSPSQEQPFLFVGQILEAGAASVYTRQEEGELTGLLIATGEEELQTP